jgi:pimeloyl-ACP methyl ester carboxylesterase
VVVIDDAGHFVWEDKPKAANRAVVGFLNRAL